MVPLTIEKHLMIENVEKPKPTIFKKESNGRINQKEASVGL